ncbi:type III secretion system inner membrane ring lipoprotein SctJ [Klebsiella pneumoniae]|uniref:type III secretion system inner membrane ring lipoprotein SctJ n=1 Tax=Klebsiella pneumoniae TaxID=573 RepID=UPI001261B0AA|nr:type III secretion inner membrane ring lipoprotein SctJ [Klebsiella pneumoniae]KAB7536399.1 EscJ/YscJ/HrcJ family type III secretion inner membrane ring protein [Klebsiella pneumoniae]
MRVTRYMKTVLLLCALLLLQGCKSELYSHLDEQNANRMVAILQSKGIAVEKQRQKDGTLSVSVDENDFVDAMRWLDAAGLPQQQHDSFEQIFKNSGLVTTPTEERARMTYALGQELGQTLGSIDGVLTSRVHVVIPQSDPLSRQTPAKPSAAVFIRYAPGTVIDDLIPRIKNLVASSVPDLDYERVSVITVAAVLPPVAAQPPSLHRIAPWWLWSLGAMLAVIILAAGWGWWRYQQRRERVFPMMP